MTHRYIAHVAVTALSVLALAHVALAAQQHPPMPPGMTHEEHLAQMAKEAEMKKRGAIAMGFDQDTTTHHFRLLADGGAIEVGVNDAADSNTRQQIRTHLEEIAKEFAQGTFDKPFATHGEVPPGVEAMQRLKERIAYAFEPTDAGGRVRITTSDAAARQAIHEFLIYQIKEHATGDPLTVQR
ncbi:MAG: hypothetical protein LAO77_25075 [Acidobacteriia bacterium]|nr:hypothetical protein [Terriglobia bacterium]